MASYQKEPQSQLAVGTKKSAVVRPARPERHPESPVTTPCSICLDEITNKCCPDSCDHFFCFSCLKTWLNIKKICPLCMKSINNIRHSFNNQGSHETYELPQSRPLSEFRNALYREVDRFFEERGVLIPDASDNDDDDEEIEENGFGDPRNFVTWIRHYNLMLMIRMEVYRINIWASPMNVALGFREEYVLDYNGEFHHNEIYRLMPFIMREIHTLRTNILVDNNRVTNEALTYSLLENLMRFNICDSEMYYFLLPYFGPHTAHFCHELNTFAASRLSMDEYDAQVLYPIRRHQQLPLPNIFGFAGQNIEAVNFVWSPLSEIFFNMNSDGAVDRLELVCAYLLETVRWDCGRCLHLMPTIQGNSENTPCDCINEALEFINAWAVQTSFLDRLQTNLVQLRSANGLPIDAARFHAALVAVIDEMYYRSHPSNYGLPGPF